MRVRVCSVDDFDDEEMIQAKVEGHAPFAVYKVNDDEYYVTDDTCTHGQASLAEEGDLEGYTITCSWHDGQFDIRTGEVLCMPCTKPIRSFPVTVEEGAIYIDIDESTA